MPTLTLPVAALTRWLRVQAVVGVGVLGATAVWPQALAHGGNWIAFGIAASWAWLWLLLEARTTAANGATAGRLVLLCVLLALLPAAPGSDWWWWSLGLVVVAADLLDGALARRFGGSEVGAILDMETDQFTVFGLALAVVAIGGARWVLVLPALRWWFVLAMTLARRPAHEPKPQDGDNSRGRRVCAAVMVALLLALCPAMPRVVADAATAVAVVLLVWSFSADARWLLTRRTA
ncbi:MAG: CDP-alcohol phosphatidyltransferase family protein [Planctomycetes bacterium]|nr:CDP-alcohol phosphatidyltransferase family protein [Planctomycetota bacterium]